MDDPSANDILERDLGERKRQQKRNSVWYPYESKTVSD
jgi:hypothetical protein